MICLCVVSVLEEAGLARARRIAATAQRMESEGFVRLAFSLIQPLFFPESSWMLHRDAITAKDAEHAIPLRERFLANYESRDDPHSQM